MAETTANNEQAKTPVAEFRIAAGARPGWPPANVLRGSILTKAVALTLLSGTLASILAGADNKVPFITKEALPYTGAFISPMYFIVLLLGGLRLVHEFNARRAAAVLINIAIAQTITIILLNREIQLSWSVIIMQSPCILWLIHTAPDAMNKFGLRKGRLTADFAVAALITALLTSYMVFTLFCYGFKLNTSYVEAALTFLSSVPMYTVIAGFFHMVWDNLRRKGADSLTLIRVMLLLFTALELPLFIPHFASVAASAGTVAAIGAMITGPLIFCILFSLTFRYCGNALPAAFTLIMLTQLLHMAGII